MIGDQLVPITEDQRRDILGLNKLRMHVIDPKGLIERTSKDEFSIARAQRIPPPWRVLRESGKRPEAAAG